jgi:hypothetical protein
METQKSSSKGRGVLLRDLIIFQIKLLLDGLKDLVVAQIAFGAAALDLLFPTEVNGRRFYAVMALAERFDGWLSLYGSAQKAADDPDGLFGASLAGSSSLLGRIEEWVTGRREVEEGGVAAA